MIDQDEKNRQRLKMIGIYGTIPFVLAIPPIVGWLIGTWLDKWLGTSPFLMYVLIVLGLIAGIREFYRILKKYGDDET